MTNNAKTADCLHIIFDGPPSPEGLRFIEVETPDGKSINAGEWSERPDGRWQLVIGHAAPNQIGAAEVEVGQAVYKRIDALMDADPRGPELNYLADLVSSVEEYGSFGGTLAAPSPQPASRTEGEAAAWQIYDSDDGWVFFDPAPAQKNPVTWAKFGWKVRALGVIASPVGTQGEARSEPKHQAVSAEDVARALYEARPGWVLHPEERPIPWDEAQTELAGRVATCREDAAVALALFRPQDDQGAGS